MFANSLGKYTKDYISLPVHIQEQVFIGLQNVLIVR